MSNNAHIDKTFKNGLGEKKFANTDAMWQKMEAVLDQDTKKKKRRFAFILLFASLLTAGFFAAKQISSTTTFTPVAKAGNKSPASINNTTDLSTAGVKTPVRPQQDLTAKVGADAGSIALSNTVSSIAQRPVLASLPVSRLLNNASYAYEPGKVNSKELVAEEGVDNTDGFAVPSANNNDPLYPSSLSKITADVSLEPVVGLRYTAAIVKPAGINLALNSTPPSPSILKKIGQRPKKISIELIGGTDILRVNRKVGYYAGVRVNRMLEEGTVVSVGLNYTNHLVKDIYRLADKPAQQKEIDGRLNDVTTIRMPVYFQRQLAHTKFSLMAGLVPTYVVNATVYNVPNSFNGNPAQYRKFEIDDINRVNVLFGAGIKYAPVKWVAFELSGSYGFTSLVKSSYINKSRVNDNFKSLQAGVAFKLR